MIEFTFRVTLKYAGDAQAFIDESLDRAHSRVAEAVKETLEADPYYRKIVIEVEPT